MTDQELEELLKGYSDSIFHDYFKQSVEPKFDALNESMLSAIKTLDRIIAKVDRLNRRLDEKEFIPEIIE